MKTDNMEFEEQGLYLVFSDGARIEFTKPAIERVTREFWEDPEKIPLGSRQAIDFQRCVKCPLRGQHDICDALRPVLPLVKAVERYVSFSEVTAYYKEDGRNLLHLADTTMQSAMRYLSILSLTQYCKLSAKYRRYFYGILPFMSGKDIAIRLYLNSYYFHGGDKEVVARLLSQFREDITMTSTNQVRRLNCITRSDVLPNAFVATQAITELLNLHIERDADELFR